MSSDPPDYDTLARRLMDLWMETWSQTATDPRMAEMMTAWIRLVQRTAAGHAASPMPGAPHWGPFSPDPAGPGGGDDPEHPPAPNTGSPAGPTDGTAPAASASDSGRDDLDELRRRIDALEHHLATRQSDTQAGTTNTGDADPGSGTGHGTGAPG